MKTTIRQASPDDVTVFGRICYQAFKDIAEQHNYPPDFPSPEMAAGMYSGLIPHPKFYSAAAELENNVVGSIIVSERSEMAGISVLTVSPEVQNQNVGRQLMEHALDYLEGRYPGVQLVQAAYHVRSLALYAKLGFEACEMLSTMQGPALNIEIEGYQVRAATEDDIEACNSIYRKVHGFDRHVELQDAIHQGTANVVEHGGQITGYSTAMAFFGHAVGESNDDLKALIGAAPAFLGPGIMIPSTNGELCRWCMENGLRNTMQTTLMTYGQYNPPKGPFMPSVLC